MLFEKRKKIFQGNLAGIGVFTNSTRYSRKLELSSLKI